MANEEIVYLQLLLISIYISANFKRIFNLCFIFMEKCTCTVYEY